MSFNHFSDAVQPPQSFCVKPSKTKCNGMSTQKMFQFSKTHFKKCNKKYQDDSVNVTIFLSRYVSVNMFSVLILSENIFRPV